MACLLLQYNPHRPKLVKVQGVGTTTPGSGIAIGKASVRGVDSFGMLCSAHDIGWSDKADGKLVIMPHHAQPGDACPSEPPDVSAPLLCCTVLCSTWVLCCGSEDSLQAACLD